MKKTRFCSSKTWFLIPIFFSLLLSITFFSHRVITSASNIPPLVALTADTGDALKYQKATVLGEKSAPIGGGGYVTGISLHPQQKDLAYIKTDIGGFYRWNSIDSNWSPLTDHFSLTQSNYYGGESLALDPNDSSIVYIATGKFTADWAQPIGTIFKSTDQGATWKKLSIDLKMGGNENLRWVGERLVVNPHNSKDIFFGSRLDGLWKSSDAGATWFKVTTFPGKLEAGIGITALVFNQQVPGLLYSVVYGDGIYQSIDTGASWNKLIDSPAFAKRISVANSGDLYVTHASGVSKYVSDRWSDITPSGTRNSFNALSVDPVNVNNVLIALGETPSTTIYQSLDGGSTWIEKIRFSNSTVPWWSEFMVSQPWISAIEFDPKVSNRVWLTDWYGIWRTEDIKANPVVWTNYERGHEEIVTFTLASPPKGALLLSGVADVDGFYHNNGLDTYPSQGFGRSGPSFQDTYSIAYCQTAPLNLVRVGGNRESSVFTGASSTDGGLHWKVFESFPANIMPMRVAVSATNPNLFVTTVSEQEPLRTLDGGISWSKVLGLPNGVKGPWNWSQPLASDPVDGNAFYYYADGKVYRSTDGGNLFSIVNSALPSEGWQSLKTMPGFKGEVWISLDSQGLHRSSDSGETFSKLSNVEKAYLFAFGKPQAGSTAPALYLYGRISEMGDGIFSSLDLGKTWKRLDRSSNPVGNSPNVMEASWQEFGLVFVGTNGRGIYYGTQKG
ncbi:hypothetical protein [Stenomitos frigidus]|uniref:Sortilin N-terminal domain-containing protein n=1 Tax=Stenomitos frigidus ULC18 TaxID=2107698 RepID=A0A2T1ECW5_9CYAN|nr:hypothetical protein [Stenomitos frigidus]PSB30592.1 hypothetical protein C7B82_08595 [Stenomitos frigidus ULC18]